MGKSLWADLENGIKDPQISTRWRIAEGLGIKPDVLVKLFEEKLGEKFSFLETHHEIKNYNFYFHCPTFQFRLSKILFFAVKFSFQSQLYFNTRFDKKEQQV